MKHGPGPMFLTKRKDLEVVSLIYYRDKVHSAFYSSSVGKASTGFSDLS